MKRIQELESELESYRQRARLVSSVNSDLIDDFLDGGHIVLPSERWEKHVERCRREAGEEATERYLTSLEEGGYRQVFEWLFYEELGIARTFDYRLARPRVSFHRGKSDIEHAASKGVPLEEMIASKHEATVTLLEGRFARILDEIRPSRIVEVGGGWGATVKYLSERYRPDEYQNYEIDRHYSEFVEQRYGARSMPADGETLHATESESMDLFVANNALFFMPMLKAFSYLDEAARVLRPAGMAIFNLPHLEERTARGLKRLLDVQFPRRTFSFLPRPFIFSCFPEEKFRDRTSEIEMGGYFLFQKR